MRIAENSKNGHFLQFFEKCAILCQQWIFTIRRGTPSVGQKIFIPSEFLLTAHFFVLSTRDDFMSIFHNCQKFDDLTKNADFSKNHQNSKNGHFLKFCREQQN